MGKSSITSAFVKDGFSPVYRQTLGVDFMEKTLHLRGDSTANVRVRDIGGQSISSNNLSKYLSGTDGVFLVYDVTNGESFDNLIDWLCVARKHSPPATPMYIIGNKVDLIAARVVSDDRHNDRIQSEGLAGGMLVSARSGEALLRTFYKVLSPPLTLSFYWLPSPLPN